MTVSIPAAQPAINSNVLMEILGANESVQARIVAFQKAKEEAEKALAALRIGKDAQKAYEDANAKYAEVVALKETAQANADAAMEALGEASSKAKDIVQEARAQSDVVMKETVKAKFDCESYVTNAKADIDAKQKQLASALDSVEKDKAAAKAAQAAAGQSKADSEAAQKAAAKAEAEFKSKAAKLQEALGQLTAAG